MKLRKAKRFNTIESYANCVCAWTTCSCSCGTCTCPSGTDFQSPYTSVDNTRAQTAYNTNHYAHNAVYARS